MKDSNGFAMDFDPSREWAFKQGNPMIDPPVLRVYLATPLTNVDSETEQDRLMVRETTKRVLQDYDYLGVRFEVYDPGDVTPPGSQHSSDEVYVTDHNRTANADLVVFHVNCPSLGVGMEAQIAAEATLPRVVVSKHGATLSRMFLGVFSPTIVTIEYTYRSDFEAQLSRQLPEIARATLESAKVRRQHLDQFRQDQLGRRIFKQRILLGITIEELARSVDIREFWLRRLEREPSLAAHVSLMQLSRIAFVTNSVASIGASGTPTLKIGDTDLPGNQRESLDNLVHFVLSQPDWIPDERIFRLWNEYAKEHQEETAEAIRYRSESENHIITIEEWGRRYSSLGLF